MFSRSCRFVISIVVIKFHFLVGDKQLTYWVIAFGGSHCHNPVNLGAAMAESCVRGML